MLFDQKINHLIAINVKTFRLDNCSNFRYFETAPKTKSGQSDFAMEFSSQVKINICGFDTHRNPK